MAKKATTGAKAACGRCGGACDPSPATYDPIDIDEGTGAAASLSPVCMACFQAWGLRGVRVQELSDRIRAERPGLAERFEGARASLYGDEDALCRLEAKLAPA